MQSHHLPPAKIWEEELYLCFDKKKNPKLLGELTKFTLHLTRKQNNRKYIIVMVQTWGPVH